MTNGNLEATRHPARAIAARRASEAWSLRVAGFSWDEVAEQVGFSDAPHAHRAVKNYFGQVPAPDREQLRTLARARGEALWKQAFADALEQRPGAVRAAVALLQRQAQLDGLDEPSRSQVTILDSDDQNAIVAELIELTGERAVEADPIADGLEGDDVEEA